MGRTNIVVRLAAVVLSGVMVGLAPAPHYLWYLHWVAFVPLFWAMDPDTPRANRWLALVQGVAATMTIYGWIAETVQLFSNVGYSLSYAVLLLFALVYGLPYPIAFAPALALRRRLGSWWILVLPAWLVVVEWAATHVLLFPYQTGVTTYRQPWLIQLASVTGIWGLSYGMVMTSAVLGEWIHRRREGRSPPWPWLVLTAVAIAGTLAFGAWRHPQVEAMLARSPVLRVQQIQTERDMVFRLSNPAQLAFQFWVDQTRKVEPGSVDLVVWPEGAVPYSLNSTTNASALLWDLVEQGEFDLLVGSGTREREPDASIGEEEVRMFNSTYFFDRDAVADGADEPTPEEVFATLVDGDCAPSSAGLVTPFETTVVVDAGVARGDAPNCVEALRTHERALRRDTTVSAAFEQMMRRDPTFWSRLRSLTARFDHPPREAWFRMRGGVGVWRMEDEACVDGDCSFVAVTCDEERGCRAYAEAPHYDKMVPVPFGEYLPLGATFPFLRDIIRGPGNFRAGTEAVVFDMGSKDGSPAVRIGTPICYEAILSYVCGRFDDVGMLVNVTNDAWFGPTAASDLHGMLAAVRATELGVPVFRSAYAGVSFVVEPHGDILYETAVYTEVNRPVQVRTGRVDTPYGRYGDWFVVLCGLLCVGSLGVAATRRTA